MNPRHLLDTHVLIRWLTEPARLSRGQERTIAEAARRGHGLAISAVTLLEIAVLSQPGSRRLRMDPGPLFDQLAKNPQVLVLPLTIDVAREVVAIGNSLRDPMDRAIVATARVHRLQLLTSDERILESRLVQTID